MNRLLKSAEIRDLEAAAGYLEDFAEGTIADSERPDAEETAAALRTLVKELDAEESEPRPLEIEVVHVTRLRLYGMIVEARRIDAVSVRQTSSSLERYAEVVVIVHGEAHVLISRRLTLMDAVLNQQLLAEAVRVRDAIVKAWHDVLVTTGRPAA
jgi:hypothetical protein